MTLLLSHQIASPSPWKTRRRATSEQRFGNAMTPVHPRWSEFREKLEGPGYCNFHKDEKGETRWECAGGRDKSHAIRLLTEMGFSVNNIVLSCEYFSDHGGFCDCEILFNVEARKPRTKKNPTRRRA